MKRRYTLLDKILIEADAALRTLVADVHSSRQHPDCQLDEAELNEAQQKQSAGLMRVNHTGEVCAQALYRGQQFVARNQKTYAMLEKACVEEVDHLAWTHSRLKALNGHRSYLNIFWYSNAFMMGALAGLAGDRWSLGFVEETEAQVTKHLESHLGRLPKQDVKSYKVVEQMREDEMQHGQAAANAGAYALPSFIRAAMSWHGKVMTTLAYYI